MAVILAFCSAICSSFSTIITKKSVKNVSSGLATLIRISFTCIFTFVIIFIGDSYQKFTSIPSENLLPLFLSGVCSGFSWLFYFKALSLGDVSQLAPVDNLSTVVTMLLAVLILHEMLNPVKAFAMILIFAGTLFMIFRNIKTKNVSSLKWLPFALLALITASCSSILVKLALKQMDSILVTGVRNLISLLIAAVSVICQKQYQSIRTIAFKTWGCLILSGILIGVSALCSYQALQMGDVSVIVPIDKSSLVFTVILSCIFLHERLNRQNWLGLSLIVVGTFLLIL